MALPGRHFFLSLCCARIYIVKICLPTYSLDYESMKNDKRGDSDPSLCGIVARGQSCGVDISGRSSGVSGGNVYGQIWVFQAQCIPVPYNRSKEATRSSKLPHSPKCHRCSHFPWIHQLLQILCAKLLCNCPPTTQSYKKRKCIQMGTPTLRGL